MKNRNSSRAKLQLNSTTISLKSFFHLIAISSWPLCVCVYVYIYVSTHFSRVSKKCIPLTEIRLFISGMLWHVHIIVMPVLCEKGGLILILLQWRVIFTENIVKTLQFCCKEIDAKPLQKDQLFSSYAYSHSNRDFFT